MPKNKKPLPEPVSEIAHQHEAPTVTVETEIPKRVRFSRRLIGPRVEVVDNAQNDKWQFVACNWALRHVTLKLKATGELLHVPMERVETISFE